MEVVGAQSRVDATSRALFRAKGFPLRDCHPGTDGLFVQARRPAKAPPCLLVSISSGIRKWSFAMPPPVESEEYQTIATVVEVYPYVKAAYEAIKFMYEFGRPTTTEKAIAELQAEIQRINVLLDDLQDQLSVLVERLAKAENESRVRAIEDIRRALGVILEQLQIDPHDRAFAAKAVIDASSRADQLITDRGLWLWTDTKLVPDADGQGKHVVPMEPDFKTSVALPVYAMAIAVWGIAIVLEAAATPGDTRPKYKDHLWRHVDAIEVRRGWKQGLDKPQSLMEEVRSRIWAEEFSESKYPKDGLCKFDVVGVDRIDLRRWVLGSVENDGYQPNELCTLSNLDLWITEAQDSNPSVQLLDALSTTLRCLAASAQFPISNPTYGVFGAQATGSDVYTVAPGGALVFHWQLLPPGNPEAPQWQYSTVVGEGWNVGRIVPGGGATIYSLKPDGFIYRFRHTGSEVDPPTADWENPWGAAVGDPGQEPGQIWGPTESRLDYVRGRAKIFGGGEGVLYAIARNFPFMIDGSPNWLRGGDLTWKRHPGYFDGKGTFTAERRIDRGWGKFRDVFSVGGGIIYGLMGDGQLYWHKHVGFATGEDNWEGPKVVGAGWAVFSSIFGGENGVVYGVRPDGAVLVYRHIDHMTGGTKWEGPYEMSEKWADKLLCFSSLPGASSRDPK